MNTEMINRFFIAIDQRGWFVKGYCLIDMREEDRTMRWIFANQARDGQTDQFRWTVRTVDGLVNVYVWKM